MKSEIEVKFVNVNHDEIRKKLTACGATLEQPMRDMRRVVIDTPELKKKAAFIRIRDEGDKVTVTYKQFDQLSVDGAKEIEIVASNFEDTVALFTAAGLPHSSLQESRRETWKLNEVEVVLDEWPWLNPYIEIEGPSEELVKLTAKKLDFDWSDGVFGDVMAAYRTQYPKLGLHDTVGSLPQVRFGDPLPDIF